MACSFLTVSRSNSGSGSVRSANSYRRRPILLVAIFLSACSHHTDLPTLGSVPGFQLTDQTGQIFDSAQTLHNRVWIADFFFTNCPGPCPRMSSQMHQVQTALAGTEVRLVSMTVDPARDTAPVLAEYSKHFEAQPGVWFFLTGAQKDLHHLARDVFKLGNVDGTLDHSMRFTLIDRTGQIRSYYQTSEEDAIPKLIADARTLMGEAK